MEKRRGGNKVKELLLIAGRGSYKSGLNTCVRGWYDTGFWSRAGREVQERQRNIIRALSALRP